MSDMLWIINKGKEDFTKIDMDLKKQITIKPFRPIQLPRQIAMRYINFPTLFACENPEEYFEGQPLRRLVIRDAGIGDLLLLEPCIRQLAKNGNDITVLTRFPEVYENNPYVKELVSMNSKAEIPKHVDVQAWDGYDDLRSYSETCKARDTDHRTDCYNQVFDLDIDDKEPQIYFSRKEHSVIKKKEEFNYIGIVCDGSHYFRRYAYGVKLIEYILKANKNNVVVIIGDGWEDGAGYVKYNKKSKRVIDLQGKTTIRQMMNVVKDMDYIISVDTGIMHVALSMHIPTVCLFSIIDPDLRIAYYKGQREVIYKKDLDCIGCGSWHMARCQHGDSHNRNFIPPCMEITPEEIYTSLKKLNKNDEPLYYFGEKKTKPKKMKVNIVKTDGKITLPIIVLNEEKNLPRFIDLVMSHHMINRVVAIDGGSDDKTVELLKKAGAEVYTHYYDKSYHDAQALQRNISFSYVQDGTKCIMMDIDECFSNELSDYLQEFSESQIPYGLLSRRTFDYYKDIGYPERQIKDYPDWQPRLFTWDKKFKWIGSPHHNVYNAPHPIKIKKDIIHFEKENKDRVGLEMLWSKMDKATKEVYV